MFVLHVHWQRSTQPSARGVFFFWAETSDAQQLSRQSRRAHKAQPHPFAATAHLLRALLERLAAPRGISIAVKTERSIELSLPATKIGPLKSPMLLHDWEISGAGEITLAPWQMPAGATGLVDAFTIFQTLPRDTELPPDMRVSEEVRFWQTVSHLVLELIAQQKELPGLVQDGTQKRFEK